METHHPHHVTHKKKWTEYLLEFFMLFLAVFLGFLAENIREDFVEKHRAKEYAVSLTTDLENDKLSMQKHMLFRDAIYKNADSLLTILKSDSFDFKEEKAAKYFRSIITRGLLATNRGTIKQLEGSGSLRLFRNKQLVTQIIQYYNSLDQADDRIKYLFNYEAQTLLPFEQQHYDVRYDDTTYRVQKLVRPFRKMDEDSRIQLYDIVIRYRYLNKSLHDYALPNSINQADSLIRQCKKEYHLENE